MSLAEQLITRGWVQGDTIDKDTGAVCLHGALIAEAGMLDDEAYLLVQPQADVSVGGKILNDIVRNEVNPTDPYMMDAIDYVSFNDSEETCYDDVLRVAKQFDEVVDWMKGQAE